MPRYEYAVYKGETLLAIGQKEEVAHTLNLSPNTVRYLCTKTAWERYKKYKGNATVAIKIDMDELDKEMEQEEGICKNKQLWKQSSQNY